jgi:rSAM/selenodomain-associated transferase 1
VTDAIIIFHRHPRLGKVKTRLAKSVGDEKALSIYKACSFYIINHILSGPNPAYIFLSDKSDLDQSHFDTKNLLIQNGVDLGLRMSNSFSEIFSKGFKKVVIVATDVPDIDNKLIQSALNSLDNKDFVLGPSVDGGYYLLGMNKFSRFLFENMTWSHGDVLADTILKIKQKNLSCELLTNLIDIDQESDLNEWLNTEAVHKELQDNIKKIHCCK